MAYPAFSQGTQSPGQAPVPAVSYVEVVEKDVTPFREFVGRVEAVQRVDLRARITGFLEKQLFEDGADVEEGDLLFVSEQPPFAARVQQAKANLEAAKAQEENARVQLQRAEELVTRGNIPIATVDERRADFLVARASVLQNEAALKDAQITYTYTEIEAPISGQIGRATVKVGNLVSPESGVLAAIVKKDPMYVTFNVAEKEYLQFRQNANRQGNARSENLNLIELELRLSNGAIYGETGTLDFADVQVDASTDTIALRGTFPNPDGLLIDQQFVVVIARTRAPQSAVVVPMTTVGVDQRGTFVMAVGEGNKVEQRMVRTGAQFGPDVVVEEGLQPGDRIITEGVTKVRPGMEVNPVPAESLAPAGNQPQ